MCVLCVLLLTWINLFYVSHLCNRMSERAREEIREEVREIDKEQVREIDKEGEQYRDC